MDKPKKWHRRPMTPGGKVRLRPQYTHTTEIERHWRCAKTFMGPPAGPANKQTLHRLERINRAKGHLRAAARLCGATPEAMARTIGIDPAIFEPMTREKAIRLGIPHPESFD